MLKVVFFARLREELGESEMTFDWQPELGDLEMLKSAIIARQPKAQTVFDGAKVLCAVNQVMVRAEHKVQDGDEVAFFPPVTGG